jgi:hypothetical protein
MATVRRSNFDWNGQPYWGLVQQNGPWSSTPGDIKRANEKDIPAFGGGIGVGGKKHAGHSIFESFMTPYQINATGAPPSPSGYARPTVMMGPVDMKRATKMGRAKQGLTLAARTPLQTGYKMGGGKEDIIQTEAGDIMPLIVVEGTNQFGSTHHIMEMPSLIAESDISMDGSSTPAYINELATNLKSVVQAASYGDTDSHVTGYTNMFRRPPSVYKFRDDMSSSKTSKPTSATSLGSMASPIADPILTYYPIEQITPEPEAEDYPIEYKSPDIIDSTMIQNLNMSQKFLDTLADYEKTKYTQMQKKRDTQINEKPVPVPIKGFKKTALDGTFLAEEANRGLKAGPSKPMSEKAKGKRRMSDSPEETSEPARKPTPKPEAEKPVPKPASKPVPKPTPKKAGPKPAPKPAPKPSERVGKKTKPEPFQIKATAGRVNGVLKRYKADIVKVWKDTKPESENFLIIDAAYKKYLKDKKKK